MGDDNKNIQEIKDLIVRLNYLTMLENLLTRFTKTTVTLTKWYAAKWIWKKWQRNVMLYSWHFLTA